MQLLSSAICLFGCSAVAFARGLKSVCPALNASASQHPSDCNWVMPQSEVLAHLGFTGDDPNQTLYLLGDSVSRFMASRLACVYSGAAVGSHAQVKEQCSINDQKDLLNRVKLCNFEGPRFRTVFAWFQWLVHPPPIGPTDMRETGQMTDACTALRFRHAGGLRECLLELLAQAKPSDVLIVRSGLQYLLYGEIFVDTVCKGMAGCHAILWEMELQRGLEHALPLLKSLFPGTLVWWLLTPFNDWNHANCEPPLQSVGSNISAANDILRVALRKHNISYVEPIATWDSPCSQQVQLSFKDCIHFFEPAQSLATTSLMRAVSAARVASESSPSFIP
jgi:hypothetical protein